MSSSRRLFPEQQRDDEDDEEEEETIVNTNDAARESGGGGDDAGNNNTFAFVWYLSLLVVCTQNLSYFIEEKNTMQSDPARASLSLSLSLSLFGQLETLLNAVRPSTWYQCRQLWLRKVNDIDASSRVGTVLRGVERPRGVDSRRVSIEMWIENRRRRWLEHVENARERRRLDEDEEEEEEH